MNRTIITFALAALCVLSFVMNAMLIGAQVPPPSFPPQLTANYDGSGIKRTLLHVSDAEYIEVWVTIDSRAKKVRLGWSAKDGLQSIRTEQVANQSLSFTPTALCRSRTNARGFYIAGRSGVAPVLEFWQFNNDEELESEWHAGPGTWQTTLQKPTIAKESKAISPSFGWPCAMTAITPAPTPGDVAHSFDLR